MCSIEYVGISLHFRNHETFGIFGIFLVLWGSGSVWNLEQAIFLEQIKRPAASGEHAMDKLKTGI